MELSEKRWIPVACALAWLAGSWVQCIASAPLPTGNQSSILVASISIFVVFLKGRKSGKLPFLLLSSFLLASARFSPPPKQSWSKPPDEGRPVQFCGQVLDSHRSDQGGFEGEIIPIPSKGGFPFRAHFPSISFSSRNNPPQGPRRFHGVLKKSSWGWQLNHLFADPSFQHHRGAFHFLTRTRNALRARLEENLPTPEAGLARALLLGEFKAVHPQRYALFRGLGLLHLLAVSGMHFWLWDSILRRLLCGRLRFLRPLLLLFAGGLAGFRAPVIRALSALFLRDWHHHSGKQVNAFHLWAGALWVECALLSPREQGLGFVLSYSATASLIWVNRTRGGNKTWRIFRSSLAASLATSPCLLARQGTLEPWSVALTPPMSLLLPPRMLGSAMACLPGSPGEMVGVFLEGLSKFENLILELIDQLPATPLVAPKISLSAWALFSLSSVVAMGLRNPKLRHITICFALLGFSGSLLYPKKGEPGFALLSVGHGLSAVTAGHQKSFLFDFGSMSISPNLLLRNKLWPHLRKNSWPVPREWALSHRDYDHSGAMKVFQKKHQSQQIFSTPGTFTEIEGMTPFQARLWNCPMRIEGESNAGGCVLELIGPSGRVLVIGDQFGRDLRWLCTVLEPGPIEVLVLPHHGRTTAGLPELLNHLRPREAWASCSEREADLAATPLLRKRNIPLRLTSEENLKWPPVENSFF